MVTPISAHKPPINQNKNLHNVLDVYQFTKTMDDLSNLQRIKNIPKCFPNNSNSISKKLNNFKLKTCLKTDIVFAVDIFMLLSLIKEVCSSHCQT